MSPDLTEKLRQRFPGFFRQLYQHESVSCMAYGIETADGWFGILEKLCEDIQATNPPEDFQFEQIKEKWGVLRIYHKCGSKSINKLIDKAVDDSYGVCEKCGSKEDVIQTDGSWIRTECAKCRGE